MRLLIMLSLISYHRFFSEIGIACTVCTLTDKNISTACPGLSAPGGTVIATPPHSGTTTLAPWQFTVAHVVNLGSGAAAGLLLLLILEMGVGGSGVEVMRGGRTPLLTPSATIDKRGFYISTVYFEDHRFTEL